jgi:hypothetical protein
MTHDASWRPDPEGMARLRADAERIIAKAAMLPVKDAAFALWRQKHELNEGLLPPMTPEQQRIARATPMAEITAKLKRDRDFAHEGPTFDWLKQAHPHASDAELKAAIIAAVSFEDTCFRQFELLGGFDTHIDRAMTAARRKHPGFLETTYRDAEGWVLYLYK